VKVLQLATHEKMGGDSFSSANTSLGISGEFLVNGKAITVDASHSLQDIANAINGASSSGVLASIVSATTDSYRLVLTSKASGSQGVDLADGSGGVLRSMGFLGSSTSLRHPTSSGARSYGYSSATGNIATLAELTGPPAAGAVTMGTFMVTLDLSGMSLNDIAEEVNAAALAAGSSVTASVVEETDAEGETLVRLAISGTTSFTDQNGILETLGILMADRDAVSQVIRSGAGFTDGDGVTAATTSTLLSDLWLNGSDARVQVGDSLSLSGTRGDGTTFTKTFAVGEGDDLQDLLNALNSETEGFGSGTSTATASLSVDGRVVVTDDAGGDSRLALSIVTHNEGGGTLDFGEFALAEKGRARELVAGRDAEFEVDGSFVTRSSNAVNDVIPGVAMNLRRVSEDPATIEVTRDVEAAVNAIQEFAEAYNKVVEFVTLQFSGAGGEEGVARAPLSGDGVFRQMRSNLRDAMLTQLLSGVGEYARLGEVGVEITRDGSFQVDQAKLKAALEGDPQSMERLFGVYGSTSVTGLSYLSAGQAAQSGTYGVEITQAASTAALTGTGFGGTYVDDGEPDTLTIRALETGSEYAVSLSHGMTLSQIASALNTELATEKVHHLQVSEAMYQDELGTVATEATTLDSLFDSEGVTLGIADGDVISISGTRGNGGSFYREFTITDITTQSLGHLRSAIQEEVGEGAVVSFSDGLLNVTAQDTGRSQLALTLSSNNAGGGTLDFGSVDTITEGRWAANITASESGGELSLAHGEYGSAHGFEITFTAGGEDGSGSLGLPEGVYEGTDVQGTMGGFAAIGSGRVLTGGEDTSVEGLMIRYEGTDTGSIGNVTFSRGVASAVELATAALMGSGAGSIKGVTDGIDPLIDRLKERIRTVEDRLEMRRESLIKRFSALEMAMSRAQAQSQWLSQQFQAMNAQTQTRR
jgi:flagellar hook-associated protein 2